MGKQYKIAVIGLKGLPAFGGAAAVGENIIDKLKNDFDFKVLSVSSHVNKKNQIEGYSQHVFKSLGNSKINILIYYLKSLFYCLFIEKFDLIHLHHRDAAFIIPLLRIKYKVIVTTHGIKLTDKWIKYERLFDFQTKLFLKYANLITCVSKNEKRIFNEKYNLNVIHIPNGVNTLNILPGKTNKNEYILFAANRIIRTKGLHILLDAFVNIDNNIELIIIGDMDHLNDYKDSLNTQIKNSHKIKFLGLIKEKNKLFEWITNAKLFVYPSYIEAMSMMILEVASLRCPMILSDIQENKDIFTNDQVLYFKSQDRLDLAKKITYATENYNDMVNRSNKAYNYILEKNNWQIISKKYGNLYNDLLSK